MTYVAIWFDVKQIWMVIKKRPPKEYYKWEMVQITTKKGKKER